MESVSIFQQRIAHTVTLATLRAQKALRLIVEQKEMPKGARHMQHFIQKPGGAIATKVEDGG